MGEARDALGGGGARDRRPGALGRDQRLAGVDEPFPPEAEDRLGDFAALVAQAIANAAAQARGAGVARAARRGRRRRAQEARAEPARRRAAAARVALDLACASRRRSCRRRRRRRRLLGGAAEELALALDELRELARGIHPAVLTDRGLEPALGALADRAPLPVDDRERPRRAPARGVEAAAYYVVAESLTNVAKYAQAEPVDVRVERLERQRGGRGRATTASAAPTRRSAPGCAASPTGSRRSTGGSASRARPAAARVVWAEIPMRVRMVRVSTTPSACAS